MFEIGNTLREARLRAGLDISDCEQRTKVRGKYLRALEEEQFDVLPSPTYVRGFLKTYADFLGVDAQLVLDEHESRFGSIDPLTGELTGRHARAARRRDPGAGTAKRKTGHRRRRTEAQMLWLAVGGVLAVALIVWMGLGESGDATPIAPATDAVLAGPQQPVTESGARTEQVPQKEAPQRLEITLIGAGDEGSYLEVRGGDANGREVFRDTLPPGETKSFVVSGGLWLRAGDTGGVQVEVNGRPHTLSGGVADFQISADGVRRVD
jgi:cytoskeleton protein RodZ